MVPKVRLFSQTFKKKEHLSYLSDTIPKTLSTWVTRNYNNILLFKVKREYFQ